MGMRNFAIGLAIAVILPCVVYYGLMTFSPAAKYNACSKEAYLDWGHPAKGHPTR